MAMDSNGRSAIDLYADFGRASRAVSTCSIGGQGMARQVGQARDGVVTEPKNRSVRGLFSINHDEAAAKGWRE